MEPIGIGLRSVATIIDTALLMVVAYMIAMVTGGGTADGFSLQGAQFFLWLLVAVGYYTGMEASAGTTIGKFMTGCVWSGSAPGRRSTCSLHWCVMCCAWSMSCSFTS